MTAVVKVEIYSDIICPWCLIGHHRLEQAVTQLDGIELDLTWLPFELNPDMPVSGMDRRAYLEGKFGAVRAKEVYDRIANVLEQENLGADTNKISRTPNTFKAHRLIYLSRQLDPSGEISRQLKLNLLDAYFRQGADIGEDDTLTDCATRAGLKPDQIASWLASNEGEGEVRQLEARAHQLGISGVPFFILNGQVGLSGAQPPEVLAQAIRDAAGSAD